MTIYDSMNHVTGGVVDTTGRSGDVGFTMTSKVVMVTYDEP